LADPGVSASDFDAGYLGIRMEGTFSSIGSNSNNHIDSIIYTNLTKGFGFQINPSSLVFVQTDTTGVLGGAYYKSLLNGNTGDDITCCIYVKQPITVGVILSRSDTFVSTAVPNGVFCHTGKY